MQNHNYTCYNMGWVDLNACRNIYNHMYMSSFNRIDNFNRAGYYNSFMPYTQYPRETYDSKGVYKPKTMDPYLSSIYGTEQSMYDPPFSAKSSLEKTVYATSPNSCFIYEQEKADMQSTLGNDFSGQSNFNLNDSFDLNTQFETSCDIALPSGKVSYAGQQMDTSNWVLESKPENDLDFLNCDIFNMDEDLAGNPTLAELNTSESFLEDLAGMVSSANMEQEANAQKPWVNDNYKSDPSVVSGQEAPKQSSSWTRVRLPEPQTEQSPKCFAFRQTSAVGRSPTATVTSEAENHNGTVNMPCLHQLLHKQSNNNTTLESQQTGSSPSQKQQSSPCSQSKRKQGSSNKDVDEKWEEIKHYIYDEENEEPVRKSSRISTESYKSAENHDLEGSESEQESHQDSDSDYGEDDSQDAWSYKKETGDGASRKSRQYFWQYNLQSKGPKGARVNFDQLDNEDPHVLKDFEDPVFDPVASEHVAGTTIRHGGKARRGDGTDVSPNPKKLYQIGQQINKLNKQIDSFVPLSETPVSSRNKSKREKNKLASRACRLKKKAQHEAYKIKLYGLDMEHKQLLRITNEMKKKFVDVVGKKLPDHNRPKQEGKENLKMTDFLEDLVAKVYTYKVAGDTTDFVNKVLCKVEDGDPTGGLDQT